MTVGSSALFRRLRKVSGVASLWKVSFRGKKKRFLVVHSSRLLSFYLAVASHKVTVGKQLAEGRVGEGGQVCYM